MDCIEVVVGGGVLDGMKEGLGVLLVLLPFGTFVYWRLVHQPPD